MTVAYQAPPSMGFSRQEYWSGLPFPSPGDLPNSGIEPGSPTFQADTLTSEPPGKPGPTLMLLNLGAKNLEYFAPQPYQRRDSRWMAAPSLKTYHGMSTGGKDELESNDNPDK